MCAAGVVGAALGAVLVVSVITGCTTYSRGERYFCFAPFDTHRCKQPPYHYPPVLYPAPVPEAY